MEQNPNNQQKHSTRNNNTRTGNSKPSEKNKRYSQSHSINSEENNVMKKEGPMNDDRIKVRDNIKYGAKGREQKQTEKHAKSYQNRSYKSNPGASSGGNSRYGRNASRGNNHCEVLGKGITSKRIETVEDIQADIERIEKDIQFEIKQIKAIKLGI